MNPFAPAKPAAGLAPKGPLAKADVVKDGTDASFMADVIEASRTVPVLVDFWAPWCGPCKQLSPILEKVVQGAKGAVRLVKIDTDKNPAFASQLRVQSIPAVYAFFQGRPVDGFVGALPESQLKAFVDRLVKLAGGALGGGGDDLAASLEEAKALLDGGDAQSAAAIYAEILQAEPENAPAYVGVIRCLLAVGQTTEARGMMDDAPDAIAKSADMTALRRQLELADQAQAAGPVDQLRARVAQNPDDHQARLDLAVALVGAGDREGGVDQLLESIKRDREWNEQAARKQLLKFFEAFGPTDKLTVMARRRLSSILFS